MVVVVMVVRVVKVVMDRIDREQTEEGQKTDRKHRTDRGRTEDKQRTDRADLRQTKLTFNFDFPGNLCLAAFAIFAMFVFKSLPRWSIRLLPSQDYYW